MQVTIDLDLSFQFLKEKIFKDCDILCADSHEDTRQLEGQGVTENCFEKHLSPEIRHPRQQDCNVNNEHCILWLHFPEPKANVSAKYAINKMLKLFCGYESAQKHSFLALKLFGQAFYVTAQTQSLSASDWCATSFLCLQVSCSTQVPSQQHWQSSPALCSCTEHSGPTKAQKVQKGQRRVGVPRQCRGAAAQRAGAGGWSGLYKQSWDQRLWDKTLHFSCLEGSSPST